MIPDLTLCVPASEPTYLYRGGGIFADSLAIKYFRGRASADPDGGPGACGGGADGS